ncbi:hypothetical protein [Mariniluteicoccus flavus]
MKPLGLLSRTNALIACIPIGLVLGALCGWIAMTLQGGGWVTFGLFGAGIGLPFAALAAALLGPNTISDESAEWDWSQRARSGAFVDLVLFLGIAGLVFGVSVQPAVLPVFAPITVGMISLLIRTLVIRGRQS